MVDFLRVKGGKVHQYVFHSNGKLTGIRPPLPAPEPTQLAAPWDVWLKNARSLVPTAPHTFTWRDGLVNLDFILLNTSDTIDRVIIADAPGWRREASKADLDKPPIQQILVEKRGDASLATQYAAVVTPYQTHASPVLSARLLANDEKTGAMAVEVRFSDRTDYLISTKDQEMRVYGPVTAAGQFAAVSVDTQGRVIQAYLLAGTRLECGDTKLSVQRPSTKLKVKAVSGRTFQLAEPLAPGLVAAGDYLLASGPEPLEKGLPRPQTGFEIASTTRDSITVRDYPVVDCDEITVLHTKAISRKDAKGKNGRRDEGTEGRRARGRMSEVRGRKTEGRARGRMSEVRCQRAEGRRDRGMD